MVMPFLLSNMENSYITTLLNKNVLEPGISKIIMNYKNPMEYIDIINYYHSNWRDISKSKHINDNFIRYYKDKIDWFVLCFHSQLSDEILIQFSEQIGWTNICMYQSLSIHFIESNLINIDFDQLIRYQILPVSFFKKYINFFDLRDIFRFQIIDDEFFILYIDEVIRRYGSEYINSFVIAFQCKYISVGLWKKYKYLLNWIFISKDIVLSEEFMECYKVNLYWKRISKYQVLSEKFIKRNVKSVYWPYIIEFQKHISNKFILENKGKID